MPNRATISDTDKERLVQAFTDGDDYVQLSRQMKISRNTAWAIIRRSLKRAGIISIPRGGRKPLSIDEEMKAVLIESVEQHPSFNLIQLKSELEARLPHKNRVSTTTIARCLTSQLIVLKQIEDCPQEKNSQSTKNNRQEYANWIMNVQVN